MGAGGTCTRVLWTLCIDRLRGHRWRGLEVHVTDKVLVRSAREQSVGVSAWDVPPT